MPTPRLHLICNAHLDPVWLWEWEEGAATAVATFRTAADLCEEFDGFVFNHNEAILYRWIEEYDPALFARIRGLVREKRWHIMGGWHLQPDCNMPSGESLVRQILTGKRYFADRFGVEPTTAVNLDPFGHSRGLPQILAKSGYDSYLFCRPSQHDCPLPADTFVWVGFDGSQVVATRHPGYNSPLGGARAKVEAWLRDHGGEPVTLVLWGVGDHGGGPSRQDLRDLAGLIRDTASPKTAHSTPEAYFAAVLKNARRLPRHNGDLNPWAVGCYTTMARVKQKHRQLENELYALERMASVAWKQGLIAYPREEIAKALYDLLTSEFHDILPGSSSPQVEDASLRLLDHGLEIVSRAKARAFLSLTAGQPKAADGEIPVLVYNPHPFPVRQVVECEFQLADQNWTDTFTDVTAYHEGRALPTQVETSAAFLNLDWRKRVAFSAELAPSSMNRFDCRLTVLPHKPDGARPVGPEGLILRGDGCEIAINGRTGLVDRYRVNGVDFVSRSAFQAAVMEDNEDPWGMTVRSFHCVAGRFRLLSPSATARFAGVRDAALAPVRVIEDGPVRTVVEALFGYGGSVICQRYYVPREGTEIRVDVRVFWNERSRALKLSIPLRFARAQLTGQAAYGASNLPSNGDEAVAQRWVAVVSRDQAHALTCVNDGVYGADFAHGTLRLTLLRSPAYCAHPIGDRPIVPQDRFHPRIDQGERCFRFWVQGGPARALLDRVDATALAHSQQPVALSFFPSGEGAAPGPFFTLSPGPVLASAVKAAEDGDDLIVRLYESSGHTNTTVLSLPGFGIEHTLTLSPFELRTLRIDTSLKTVTETDLLERPLPADRA